MREYECPNCFEYIEVPDHETEAVHCKHCDFNIQVDRDGEFVDGMWRDLTTLSIPKPLTSHA